MKKLFRIVALTLRNSNDIYPLPVATVIKVGCNDVYEITQLSNSPHAYEIVRNGKVTRSAWYPEVDNRKVPNLPICNLFEWVAEQCQ